MRVLIVDDSAMICTRLRNFLRNVRNVRVVGEARDGDSAIRIFEELHPDGVILDLGMPGKSGYEVLHHIKARDRDCIVMILTNHSDAFTRERCRSAGAEYFLEKSTEFEMVATIFEQLEAARRSRGGSGESP